MEMGDKLLGKERTPPEKAPLPGCSSSVSAPLVVRRCLTCSWEVVAKEPRGLWRGNNLEHRQNVQDADRS